VCGLRKRPAARHALLLGRIASGENPAEEREFDRKAISVTELCDRYLADAESKKRLPKKASTLATNRGRMIGASSRFSAPVGRRT
jgi:hypothetical protein